MVQVRCSVVLRPRDSGRLRAKHHLRVKDLPAKAHLRKVIRSRELLLRATHLRVVESVICSELETEKFRFNLHIEFDQKLQR